MRIIDHIVEIYKTNENIWLNYNEIYDLINKDVFGPNKHGERGKRNIVYRLLLNYTDLFEVDDNYRPKKFRLALNDNEKENVDLKKKYTVGESALYFNNKMFNEVTFSLEREYEKEVEKNHKFIFGEGANYYSVKKKIGNRICDGFVYDQDLGKLLVIENELGIHDLWGHIIPQIIEFFNGMNDEDTKMKLKYNVEWQDNHKLSVIEAIDKAAYEIIVVIDQINFDIKKARKDINELLKYFTRNKEVRIYFKEFKVFSSVDGEFIYQVK
ncbi:hypothetical protein HUB98_21890 [Paenibacillus barcinonensis]|uniref:Uncharacterized protein n=1 Tax=Paenibacillus barcinonensis TaxID=198119 RepID=A0A2V4VET7_PAEBA|nr:hypothetical protein [Paenibacillus barcinonensis]PYE47226.1 hypothetical protein DFQ00_11575 [Paenibacillus barcinonensis]QKS58614.1 hypothetical protein HUB98_21890 [Paenibacillus barcinonensis]